MRSTTFAVPNAATAIAQPGVGRFLLIALSAMAVFYGLIYFPYRAGSLAAHVLSGYVELIAAMAGVMLHLFDGTVAVTGHQISGRFPLNIILDCSALDAQALYLAAVLGVRARLFDKTLGLMGGFALLTAVNLARIVTLYLVGVRAPRLFHVLHEEILQIGLVLCALLTFGLWARWAHARFTCAT